MNGFTTKLLVLCLAAASLLSATTYTHPYSSVSTVTISAGTSGMANPRFAVTLSDGTNLWNGGWDGDCSTKAFCYAINQSTYSVTISSFSEDLWPYGFTGDVRLRGGAPASDTAGGGDFQLTLPYPYSSIQVGNSEGTVRRTHEGVIYVQETPVTLAAYGGYDCDGHVTVYVSSSGRFKFAHSKGGDCLDYPSHGLATAESLADPSSPADLGDSGFPIGYITQGHYDAFTNSIVDLRPF